MEKRINKVTPENTNNEKKISSIQNRMKIFFDEDYYLSNNQDISDSKTNPLEHYVKVGWRENRKPNNWYSDSLVPSNLIVRNPSTPPFVLFLVSITDDILEEYKTNKIYLINRDIGHKDCWECSQMKDHFHASYYRRRFQDTADIADVLAHFCELGWREGRDPSPLFNTSYYLQSHPDVVRANVNPFVHYLTMGINEGRKSQPDDIVKKRLMESLKTVPVASHEYSKITPEISISSKNELFLKLFQKIQSSSSDIILTISHDNYLVHTGGIQKLILSESLWARDKNLIYIHLCPTLPNIDIIKGGISAAFLVNCTVANEFLGTFTITEIVKVLDDLVEKGLDVCQSAVIHSVMGWNLDFLNDMFNARFKEIYFYAHDYFALCPEHRLLRNGLMPCDAPPIDSAACSICIHKSQRKDHIKLFSKFFDSIKPHIIFPSPCAQKIFMESGRYPKLKSTVIPHLTITTGKPKDELVKEIATKKTNTAKLATKIRIAFCGAPVGHKGFFHFEKIYDMCRDNELLEFIHLGSSKSNVPGLTYVEVKLKEGKSVMSSAIKDEKIDLAFVGSTWRETFNFVAYEALEGGAAIISLESSGNVVDLINNYGVGAVIPDWQEVLKLLSEKNLSERVNKWKESALSLKFHENKSIFTKAFNHE